jgi:hypothetical protein
VLHRLLSGNGLVASLHDLKVVLGQVETHALTVKFVGIYKEDGERRLRGEARHPASLARKGDAVD